MRAALKKKYGVFAGKEAPEFPGIKRRAGIPTLVIIGAGFEEFGLYDCDDGGNGLKLLNSKGAGAFDDWAKYAWAPVANRSASFLATGDTIKQVEAALEEMRTSFAQKAKWEAEKMQLEETDRALDEGLATQGRSYEWKAGPVQLSAAWADFLSEPARARAGPARLARRPQGQARRAGDAAGEAQRG